MSGETTTHASGPSSKRRPIFTTTGWPSVHHYTMPTGQFVLANGLAGAEQRELFTSHIGLSQRGLQVQLAWSLSSHDQRQRHQLFLSNAFSKRSHPSSSCPPTINELLVTRASCPRRGLWPGLTLFSHNPRRQRQRLLADALFKHSRGSQWPWCSAPSPWDFRLLIAHTSSLRRAFSRAQDLHPCTRSHGGHSTCVWPRPCLCRVIGPKQSSWSRSFHCPLFPV